MWYMMDSRYDSNCKHSLLGRKPVKTPLDFSLKQRTMEKCKEEMLEWERIEKIDHE